MKSLSRPVFAVRGKNRLAAGGLKQRRLTKLQKKQFFIDLSFRDRPVGI
jgi:hypothetical protein